MKRPRLVLTPNRIRTLALRYTGEQTAKNREAERQLVEDIGPAIRKAECVEKGQFLGLCRWKSPRLLPHAMKNSAERVEEATRLAFGAHDEGLRVGILMALNGVGWPMASVLLHFGHIDPYPILDFRALESLGIEQPSSYTFGFWWTYVERCRRLAEKHGVDMRMLDRALWQYSIEKG